MTFIRRSKEQLDEVRRQIEGGIERLCHKCNTVKKKEDYYPSSWSKPEGYCRECGAIHKAQHRAKTYDCLPEVIAYRNEIQKAVESAKRLGVYRMHREIAYQNMGDTCSDCGAIISHPSCARFYDRDEDKTYAVDRGVKAIRLHAEKTYRLVCSACHNIKKWEASISDLQRKKEEWKSLKSLKNLKSN